jgi:hypothetical protein
MPQKRKVAYATAVLLLGLAAGATGQEVNSDIKIPPPTVTMSAAVVVSGFFVGPDSMFGGTGSGLEFQGAVSEAMRGLSSEDETRSRLGDFVTSLLIREGVITFDESPPARDATLHRPAGGSMPAWSGLAPTTLSASRTGSARRR